MQSASYFGDRCRVLTAVSWLSEHAEAACRGRTELRSRCTQCFCRGVAAATGIRITFLSLRTCIAIAVRLRFGTGAYVPKCAVSVASATELDHFPVDRLALGAIPSVMRPLDSYLMP